MPVIDLVFPVTGKTLPIDHGYALYSAVSRLLGPTFHDTDHIGLFAIRGSRTAPGTIAVDNSWLRIRTPLEHIPAILKLAGRLLELDGHRLRLGVPRTLGLIPAATLAARMVTIKGFREPAGFLDGVRRKLDELGVAGQAGVPNTAAGPHQGKPVRRILTVKDKKVVGFALLVSELTAEESLTLQEQGIGGRRHMGCGLFLPWRPRE
ncbi:MAG TPA: type I-MYXAN CRISPR-associated protein Cas6/Cmx6 [Phycisphaerae bacterium]|nr:type I-MYXAN CRISPR-associated protein Cas6/Cmx6 [Phycisphaerae bacterium]